MKKKRKKVPTIKVGNPPVEMTAAEFIKKFEADVAKIRGGPEEAAVIRRLFRLTPKKANMLLY